MSRGWGEAVRGAFRAGVLCGLLVTACGPDAPRDARPLVAVSVAPQRFVVRAVAGDLVRVEVMIPRGASPHTYEPTLQQIRALDEAALYVKVGHPNFPFEAIWLDRILADAPGLAVVDASAGLPRRDDDPHLWLVPRHVEHMAVQVEAALEKLLPAERDTLRANLDAFRGRARALDREIRGLLEDEKGGEFFVFHPAWGYFAEEYGLRQVAVEHEHKEPDPHELAELIEHARESKVRVIFIQPQFDRKSAQTLAQETGARVEVLDPLAEDWEANLRHAAHALAEGLAP
jgi:zinc transport system substrate-binding protein